MVYTRHNITHYAANLVVKMLIFYILFGIVSFVVGFRPILMFVWGLIGTFLAALLLFQEIDKLITERLDGHDDSWNRDDTTRPRKKPGDKSRTDKSDLETVKAHNQRSEPAWVSLRTEKYKHRKTDRDDDGITLEVSDGEKTGKFRIQNGSITVESSEVEQKHGEEWVKEAKSYLKERNLT